MDSTISLVLPQISFSAEAIKSDTSLDDALIAVPETSGFAATFHSVKTEMTSNEEVKGERGTPPTVSEKDASEQIEISFTPTIKPRKYSLKPEVCLHGFIFNLAILLGALELIELRLLRIGLKMLPLS